MRNAEEHKKLLEQIAELERDSVNYFDVEREFFLITSDNLSDVQTRFYGYSIQESGIYEEDNLTEEAVAGLDGRGCYVYVEVKDGQITIKQDLNGCWGIYLFRHGDDFALSNSFFRLLDHVKFRYPLTVNRDYCNYFMINGVSINSYSETAVNEIKFLVRNATLHIDIAKNDLQIILIDYKEHSVPLDSEEGVAILDRWVDFWSNVMRGIASHTKFFQADLSGGFDTRISLVPLLNSGINLNDIRVYSSKDDNPIALEDYAIASQIANRYGFKLNQPLPKRKFLNCSLNDMWNSDLYHQQTIRNLYGAFFTPTTVEKLYYLKGLSGEVMRKTWHTSPKTFLDNLLSTTNRYSRPLAGELAHSVRNFIESIYRVVRDKYKIEDMNSVDIPQYLYHETRTRNHCGKEISGHFLKNTIIIAPALDPEVQTLQLKSSNCPDYNFLMVFLFARYAPDLLKIPFDKYHEPVDLENIIPYVKKLNERFPRRLTPDKTAWGGVFNLQPRDTQAEKILASGRNNKPVNRDLPDVCLKAVFDSSKTYGLFTRYFDAELYNYAASYYDTHVFGYSRFLHGIIGVTRVLEDVEISQRNHPPYRDMQRFLEQDFCKVPGEDDAAQIVRKFGNYITARVDIKLETAEGDFQLVSVSDDKAKVSKPGWFQKDGIGYVITSYNGKMEIVAKASASGQVQLRLLGRDVRDENSTHIPYWIDYTALTVNGEKIFDTLTPAWHNKPYRHTIDVKADEEITIQVEWLPHRSDT